MPSNNANIVKVDNILTEARYTLSKLEMDIYFVILSFMSEKDDEKTLYRIDISEQEKLTGNKWHIRQVREATKGLLSKVIEFYDYEDNYIQASFIEMAKYINKKGIIEIKVTQALKPFLLNLKSRYTTFQLVSSLALTSKFAKRIYMLCSQWKSTGITRKYKIEELKYMLNLIDTETNKEQLKNWSQFKEKVLDLSVKQINTYTDLKINYRLEKEGKKITHIIFDVEKTDASQQIIDFSITEETLALKERIISKYKLRKDQADKILANNDIPTIKKLLYDIQLKNANGEIKSIGAYSASVFNV